MKYQVTQQFIHDEEKVIAEFRQLSDAKQFIHSKIAFDQQRSLIIIYRLYIDQRLHDQYNKDKITTPLATARYAESCLKLPCSLSYRFTIRLSQTPTEILASFDIKNDAELFLHAVCLLDDQLSYLVFDDQRLIDTCNAKRFATESGSNTASHAIIFHPTPLNMSPYPPGTPPPWVKDSDEDDSQS